MQKSAALKNTYKIAGILYIVSMGIQCLMTVSSVPLRFLNQGNPVNMTGGDLAVFIAEQMLYLPFILLGFQRARESEITQQKARTTLILLLIFEIARLILAFALPMLAIYVGWVGVGYSAASSLLRGFGFLSVAATAMMFCAAAVEFYAGSPNKSSYLTNYTAMFGMFGFCGCILLQILGVMLSEQLNGLFTSSSALTLPLKWKLILLGSLIAEILPPALVAVWSYFDRKVTSGKALTRMILTPVLYYLPVLLYRLVGKLILTRLTAMDGSETMAAFSIAQSIASMPNILAYAGLIFVCCTGAMELYQVKHPSSDGAISLT